MPIFMDRHFIEGATHHAISNAHEKDLYVRIGISAGEPIEDHGDLFGSAVQLAARLCGFADPEQIVVSEFIADHYEGMETSLAIGEVSLKGFRQPVRAYSVNF